MDTHINSAVPASRVIGTNRFPGGGFLAHSRALAAIACCHAAVNVIGYAETPCDAIEQIRRSQPDVVILDIKLKGGKRHRCSARGQAAHAAIVVVMLTNYTSPQFRSQCMQAGADYFLDKTNEFQKIAPILEKRNRTHEQ
jgi:DNA-binding NarL/FixJ family response regulator